jgi:hypothetical protein
VRREEKCRQALWWKNMKQRDHLDDPGRSGRTTVKWIFMKQDGMPWPGYIWLRTDTVTGGCEQSNEA